MDNDETNDALMDTTAETATTKSEEVKKEESDGNVKGTKEENEPKKEEQKGEEQSTTQNNKDESTNQNNDGDDDDNQDTKEEVNKEEDENKKMKIREKYDSLERRFGIESYYSHSFVSKEGKNEEDVDDGFAAVLKARYSDFVVHEVDLDGNIAKLTKLQHRGDEITNDEKQDKSPDKMDIDTAEEKKDGVNAVDGTEKRDASELKEQNDDNDPSGTTKNAAADGTKKEEDGESNEPSAKKLKTETDEKEKATNEQQKVEKEKELQEKKKQKIEAQKELVKYVGEEEAKKAVALLMHWEKLEDEKKARLASIKEQKPQGKEEAKKEEPKVKEEESKVGGGRQPPKIITASSSSQKKEKYYILPPISEKTKRKSIHQLLKTHPFFIATTLADTKEGGKIRLWHKRFYRDMPNKIDRQQGSGYFRRDGGGRGGGRGGRGERRIKKEWPKDRPDYLRFVLYKENIDTSTAVKDIIRYARLNPRQNFGRRGGGRGGRGRFQQQQERVNIGYAGMKDKRGITTQYCTVYRKEPSDLLVLNGNKDDGSIGGCGSSTNGGSCLLRVGHFSYVKEELKIGMLSGNRFDIVLRNVNIGGSGDCALNASLSSDATKKDDREEGENVEKQMTKTIQHLETIAKSFQQYGFVNYFGMQRFGKYFDTADVGLAVLKGDFEAAVDIIMRPKKEDYEEEQAKNNDDTKEQEEIYGGGGRRRQQYQKNRHQINVGEARIRWSKRFDDIPKKSNDNTDDKDKDEDLRKDAERKCAKEILPKLGRFMVCETSIINHLSHKPRDYKGAFGCIAKYLRLMFLHSYQSLLWNKAASRRLMKTATPTTAENVLCEEHTVRVGDLVLIEDKSLKEGGSGTSGLGGKKVKVLDEDDIKSQKYSITDVVLPLVGYKIRFPRDEIGRFLNAILKKDGLTIEHFDRIEDRELALGGDYRKLLCRPSDVDFEIKQYYDPLQPLLQTDLMAVHSMPVPPPAVTNKKNVTDNNSNDDICSNDDDNKTKAEKEKKTTATLLGMVIGFTLPPSSYATIALRELMKRPTSSEYQSKLLLEGDCERNLLQA